MESNQSQTTPTEATAALESLSTDRSALAGRVTVPQSLMAAYGALGATFVASAAYANPGDNYEAPKTVWLAIVGLVIVAHLVRKETGVRFRALGKRANALLGALMAVILVLFSVSLGFVASDLRWPVAIASVVAFGLTTWLSGLACRAAIDNLRHA